MGHQISGKKLRGNYYHLNEILDEVLLYVDYQRFFK